MVAPRASARSSRSMTIIHAPSPSTKPSRPLSNGREACAGRSLYAIDTTFIREKPKIMPGVTHASVPPDPRVAFRIGAVVGGPDIVARERRHLVHRDVAHRGGDAARELGRVELGDRAGPAAAAAHRVPEPFAPDAERRHDADPGDHD